MIECDICGDEVKNMHGLRVHKSQKHSHNGARPKPDDVDLPDDKIWSELTPYQRYYYQHRGEEIERPSKRRQELKDWYQSIKEDLSCEECGEERSVCLEFHHTGEKDKNISNMVKDGYGRDTILSEMEKCIVLCANCHRVRHRKT